MFCARRFHNVSTTARRFGEWCVARASRLIARAYRVLPEGWR